LGKFKQNLDEFDEIWAKVITIWTNLIRFGQNKNFVSQKHYISYGYAFNTST